MQDVYRTKIVTILGIILMGLGLFLLAYFASPVRLFIRDATQFKNNPILPILGVLMLVGGIALLCATRPRS
jgi:hypothetical protein